MIKIFVFDVETGRMELFYRQPNEAMPYVVNDMLTVQEFTKNSSSRIIWTTKQTMLSYNATKKLWRNPMTVQNAFHSITEPGWATKAVHTSGVAVDVEGMSDQERNTFYNLMVNNDVWSFVMATAYSDGYVHVDNRYLEPTCEYVLYPTLSMNNISTYVLALQDGLIFLGYLINNHLTGQFDMATRSAVLKMQKDLKVAADGVVGCKTWQSLINVINLKNSYIEP